MASSEKPMNMKDKSAPATSPAAPHPNVRVLEGLLHKGNKRQSKKKSLLRLRHMVMIASFLGLVAIPTITASFYMAFIAADQYQSSASFTVRSIDSMPASGDILGMFSQTGATSTVSDSYILSDYVLSEQMVRQLDEKFNLEQLFAVRGGDFFYGMAEDMPIEEKVSFWQSVASMDYDHASNIIQLKIKAFEPQQAQELLAYVLTACEKLINELSETARTEALRTARLEVNLAEKRLSDARLAVHDFRDRSQDVDPVEGAKLAVQLVAAMEERLVRLNSDLATARNQMAEDTPRVRVIKAQISSLTEQIEQERLRLGGGTADASPTDSAAGPLSDQSVSSRLQIYETLETEREFSQQAYTAAMANLEKARIDATGKQRYLATFLQPTLSEVAQFPRRFLNVMLVMIGGFFLWGMLTLGYYNLRDRA